jgi:hypothetical protein
MGVQGDGRRRNPPLWSALQEGRPERRSWRCAPVRKRKNDHRSPALFKRALPIEERGSLCPIPAPAVVVPGFVTLAAAGI